jgi:hypothetical protein
MLTYNIPSNVLSAAPITSAPGKVMAVAPNNSLVLVNDPIRQVFYLYSVVGSYTNTFSGMGASAFWTPDSSTLYITDSAALGNGHNDTLYVFNGGTGWATYPLPSSVGAENTPLVPGAQSLAVTVPSVGAYASGSPTVAHTWCPSGTVNSYDTMSFYPQADEVRDASNDPVQTDVLAATTDGNHILGAALVNGNITLSDIGVTIPTSPCPETTTGTPPVETLDPLLIAHTLSQAQLSGLAATAVNQILASPASNLAFITYTAPATNTNAVLPYYQPQVGNTGILGNVGSIKLTGSASISAPVAGAFTPDDSIFFLSTVGDNLIHFIDVKSLTDKQQIAPNLPACTPLSSGGADAGCTYTGTGTIVPATAIVIKPRSTT